MGLFDIFKKKDSDSTLSRDGFERMHAGLMFWRAGPPGYLNANQSFTGVIQSDPNSPLGYAARGINAVHFAEEYLHALCTWDQDEWLGGSLKPLPPLSKKDRTRDIAQSHASLVNHAVEDLQQALRFNLTRKRLEAAIHFHLYEALIQKTIWVDSEIESQRICEEAGTQYYKAKALWGRHIYYLQDLPAAFEV
jgi:hypothetical protein